MFVGNNIDSHGGSAHLDGELEILYEFYMRKTFTVYKNAFTAWHDSSYKRKNSDMALLFSVSANADFNALSSHFNGDI